MKLTKDIKFIKETLALAVKAEGLTSPNPLVGALLVKGNKVIGRGYHKKTGSPHAEIIAIKSAGQKTQGSTLYINLEPCNHFGRTPPCAPEIIKAGIKRVVIAMQDPNPLVSGKGIKKLRSAGIDVITGILQQDARKINEPYTKYITKKMPFVVLKWAMSIDGKIATQTGDSKWISSENSRKFVHKLRGKFDAVLIGINTLLKDNPQLKTHGLGMKEPKRIVVDSNGEIPLGCNLLKTAGGQVIVAATDKISKDKMMELKKRGVEIMVIPSKQGEVNPALSKNKESNTEEKSGVNLKELMIELAKREITSVLVEGGGRITASFIENNLADKLIAFISPAIIGGKNAISPVEGTGVKKISDAIKIQDFSMRRIGDDVVMEGYF